LRFLRLAAYWRLIYFDRYVSRGDFAGLYNKVRNRSVGRARPSERVTQQICEAIDVACIWYWKEVLCLQRSAATTYLLKQFGVPAQLVIGAQQMPLRSHAWVEVDGKVVNDKPYISEMYAVLDRC
jgi:hypothetical protein